MSGIDAIFSTALSPLPRGERRDDEFAHPSNRELTDRFVAAKGNILKELTGSEITDSGRDSDGVLWVKMNIYLKRNGMSGEYKVEAAFNEYGGWEFANLEPFVRPKR